MKKELEAPPAHEGKATLREYFRMLEDRPEKFTPEQVGYKEKAPRGQDEKCWRCAHFYYSAIDLHNVCEIMRPASEDVKPEGACLFWTDDPNFEEHPLLGK